MVMPSVKPDPSPQPRRPYNSPERARRAAQTRARIITAAHELFLERGYFPTTVRAIAGAAGVAEKTVYLAFANKPALLDAVIDAAIADAQPTTPSTQEHTAGLDVGGEILHTFSQTAAAIMQRTARVLGIAESAATIDPELAETRERGHATMRKRFGVIAATLNARGALAPHISEGYAAATIYALVNDTTYLRLTEQYGWSAQEYAHWLERTLTTTLTHTPPPPGKPKPKTSR
jgi:AcrR family transcriptional regulator